MRHVGLGHSIVVETTYEAFVYEDVKQKREKEEKTRLDRMRAFLLTMNPVLYITYLALVRFPG